MGNANEADADNACVQFRHIASCALHSLPGGKSCVHPRQSDNDGSVEDLLDRLAGSEERQQRLQDTEDQSSEDRAGIGPDAAEDRRSTDDGGRH